MLYSPGSDAPQTQVPVVSDPAVAQPAQHTAQAAPIDATALMAAINADREKREAGVRAEQERDTYKTRAEKAEERLQDIEKSKANALLDPASFFKKMGYNDKELATTAEGIMFSLLPDKAPPDHRAKLVEAQMLRDRAATEQREKDRETQVQQAQVDAQARYDKDMETQYTSHLLEGAKTFKTGEFPASQAWYGSDHALYSRELLATARELADAATKAGTKINLAAPNIAAELEKKNAERAARFATFSGKPAEAVKLPIETQVPLKDVPKVNPRKLTDKEIIERAAAAAFSV